jgi:hypothetical protein
MISPPSGRFSHLQMFRIGCTLFIPSYLSVTVYRHFASAKDDGDFIVMALLAFSTSVAPRRDSAIPHADTLPASGQLDSAASLSVTRLLQFC